MDEKERLVRIKKYLDIGILSVEDVDSDDLEEILKMYDEEIDTLQKEAAKKTEILLQNMHEN